VRLPERPPRVLGVRRDAPPLTVPGTPPSSLLPVDRIFLAFNLIFAILLGTFVPVAPQAAWLVLAHLAALALPGILVRAGPRLAALRELYPIIGVCLCWTELGIRYAWVNTTPNDRLLTAIELGIFGYQPSLEWMRMLPAAGPLMHGWYAAYYVALIGVPLLVLASRRRSAIRSLVLRISMSYLGCFLIYAVFPALGPDELYGAEGAAAVGGALYGVHSAIQAAGNSLGTAFPSSHVAGAITLAWIAVKWCPRAVAWASSVLAGGMGLAAVYTGNHFVLDVVAGAILAIVLQAFVAPALERGPIRLLGSEPGFPSGSPAVVATESAT
jgi:membrane-associated phospholipid phosphatase